MEGSGWLFVALKLVALTVITPVGALFQIGVTEWLKAGMAGRAVLDPKRELSRIVASLLHRGPCSRTSRRGWVAVEVEPEAA